MLIDTVFAHDMYTKVYEIYDDWLISRQSCEGCETVSWNTDFRQSWIGMRDQESDQKSVAYI